MKICNTCNQVFEYPTWYHCLRCFRHGFMSMKGEGFCTDCSNFFQFDTPDPLKPVFDFQRRLIQ